MLILTMAIFVV